MIRLSILCLVLLLASPLLVDAEKIKFNLNDLEGLGELFNGLAGAAKQKKDGTCPSACDGHPHEDTWYPAPKPRVRPYSNGCSVPKSMRDSIGDYSLFDGCCDLHDSCYMACGIPKPYCEKQFQKCLTQTCDATHSTHSRKSSCQNMASMFTTGTSLFGCSGYHDLQNYGCDCLPPQKAEQRIQQWARDVYAAYNQTELPQMVVDRFLTHPKSRSKTTRQNYHGTLMYKMFERFPEIIDKISKDGQSSRDHPSYFDVPKRLAGSEF